MYNIVIANKQYRFDVDLNLINSKVDQDLLSKYLDAVIEYYSGDDYELEDTDFDDLEKEVLSQLEPELCSYFKRIIYRDGMFQTRHENNQQISLYKIKFDVNKPTLSLNEINNWFPSSSELLMSPKFDGCSLKIVWNKNFTNIELIQTRGGMDVTDKFKSMPDVIDTSKYKLHQIFGELIIKKDLFNEYYSDTYKNPRNFVGSLTKQNNLNQSIVEHLSFITFSDGCNPINTNIWTSKNNDYVNIFELWKKELPYEIDGIVLAERKYYAERPIKDNYPLNMVAVKFPSEEVETTVIGIEWTQKKTGNLIPTVVFEPVEIGGSVVQKASGFNYENLVSNGIGYGAIVKVTKSGEIIPYITKVLKKSNFYQMPKVPYRINGKHLVSLDDSETKKFKFINALKILQLEGIGEKNAEIIGQVLDFNILECFCRAKKPDIINILGAHSNTYFDFKKIYERDTLTLDTLIQLLQFEGVGPKIAYKVALRITGLSKDTSGISADIVSMFAQSGKGLKQIREAVQILTSYGVRIVQPVVITDETITYEMTGAPEGMSKSEFEARLKHMAPNAVHTTLTKTTKYLFTDDLNSQSSKMNKARKYNCKIMTYKDVLKNGL